jgi:putative N6-adenine-specific DNA methylase
MGRLIFQFVALYQNITRPISKETAFQKRLKRQVVGRVREYFAVTAPGIEKRCLEELRNLPLSEQDAAAVTGGVRFRGRLVDCYLANLHLRTAGRVLMRIDIFKATGFSRLAARLSQIPWELFLPPGATPSVRVSTRQCRLYHGDAIAARVLDGIHRRLADRREERGVGEPPPQQVFIRGVHDRFTVSVDSSGDNLYKRGIKRHGGKAPIRETTAAAVLDAAGYRVGEPLIDPMCGSGTFGLEAVMGSLNIPAGWFRDFAFTAWPSFQAKRWDDIKRSSREQFTDLPSPVVFASDRNRQACDRLIHSAHTFGLSGALSVTRRDFFSFSPGDVTPGAGLVVVNPPYGRRLGSPGRSGRTLNRIAGHLKAVYRGWRFALIVPGAQGVPERLRPCRSIHLVHGGLDLKLLIGKIE